MKIVFLSLFVMFSLSTPSFADELKLYLFRSPLGVNWSTPWRLATSILKNQVAPVGDRPAFSISHVMVELKCDSIGKHMMRAMTSANNTEERDLLLKQKYGFGIMFHTYAGHIEKEDMISSAIASYQGDVRRADLSIKVSGETCERMLSYAEEYEDLGYGNMYGGLDARPLKRQGAGCSAFAVSFMEVGGLMDTFTEEWKTIIDVPKRFIGGPQTGYRVGITKILTHPRARWNSHEPSIHLEAWDPEAIHTWVGKIYHQVLSGQYEGKWPANISREGNTLHVELDMENRPTPKGPFWL